MSIAYTAIIDGPNKDGFSNRLVLADSDGGYSEMKETGDAADPLFVAKGPIWFETRAEAQAEVNRRNQFELHLTPEEANKIVSESMFGVRV